MNSFSNFIFGLGRLAFAGLLIWFALEHAKNWAGQSGRAVDNQIVANALNDTNNLNEFQSSTNKVGMLEFFHTQASKQTAEQKKAIQETANKRLAANTPLPFGMDQFRKLDEWIAPGSTSFVSKIWPFILGGLALICLIGPKLLFTWIVRLVVGVLFLYNGLTKILAEDGFGKFASSIMDYEFSFINQETAHLLATTLPFVEVVAGALFLLLAWRAHPANLLIIVLLSVFTAAIAWAVIQGLDINCGCGGEEPVSWYKVIKNSVLILACLAVLVYRPWRRSRPDDPRDAWQRAEASGA